MGDYNDLLSNSEKRGSADRDPWLLRGFREAVLESNLCDIPMEGHPFTWSKRIDTTIEKHERLDRALATSEWLLYFPTSRLINIVADRSDHTPIFMQLYEQARPGRKFCFRFENNWLHEEELEAMLKRGWEVDTNGNVQQKLHSCATVLGRWGQQLCNRFRMDINRCRVKLDQLHCSSDTSAGTQYIATQQKMSELLAKEEAYWKQRAKTLWYKDGDSNTKFFHVVASARKKRNSIKKLKDSNDEVVEDKDDLCRVAKNYFENLISASSSNYAAVTDFITQRITPRDNACLIAPFKFSEFKEALSHMHSDKAPSSDGFNPAFYKHFWDQCGNEIFGAAVTWLEEGTASLK